MVEDLRKWENLIDKYDSLVWKLERFKVSKFGNNFLSLKILSVSFECF